MLARVLKSNKAVLAQARMFSYNYSNPAHGRVFLDVSKDGNNAGRLVFELYDTHSPELAQNFRDLCTGHAEGNRSYVGTTFSAGHAGHGIQGGDLHEEENWGASRMRLADENLETRHHKRGILTMVNDGPHSNGSQFLVTFGDAHHLNGYNNVIGELVEGDSVLSQMEQSCDRYTGVGASWKVTGAGAH